MSKPYVFGRKDGKGRWCYVATCARCNWSFGWVDKVDWDLAMGVAEAHWELSRDVLIPVGAPRPRGMNL